MRRLLLLALIAGTLAALRSAPPEPAAGTAPRLELPAFALLPGKYRIYDYGFECDRPFIMASGWVGYGPSAWPDIPPHEFRFGYGQAGSHLAAARRHARLVLPMIVAAIYRYKPFPNSHEATKSQRLGPEFNAYANSRGTDAEHFESFIDAAKRIVAGGATLKRTPDATSRWLDNTADAILAHVRVAEVVAGSRRGREFDATLTELRILAQFARFHARRAIGAVHYNLFKRSLRLGELFAATMEERKAVAAWRELVAAAGDHTESARGFSRYGHWRDELKLLEAGLKELEEQCCPPDEVVLRELVWSPRAAGDR
jgi:hypothetical protein